VGERVGEWGGGVQQGHSKLLVSYFRIFVMPKVLSSTKNNYVLF
jgi:hypothetical protein